MFGKKMVATLVAEFLGTGILALVFLSVKYTNIGVPWFIALAAGAAVAVGAFYFADNADIHMNPAITIAVMTARKIGVALGALTIVFQLLGAWAAYGVYHYFVANKLPVIGGNYSARVLFAEAVGTLILALAWGAVYYRRLQHTNRSLLLGGSYALAIMVAAGAGLGIANPAVALSIRAWNIWGSMGWGTYLLGPVLGAVIGVNLYALLFATNDELVADETLVVAEAVVPAATTARSSRSSARTSGAKKTTTRKTTTRRSTTNRRRR